MHYFRAIGQEVEVYRNDQITVAEITKKQPQYLVISPGPCSPNEAGISLAAIAEFSGKIPILGVCLGHQCIAQHFGAKIIKAKKLMHGKLSQIKHSETGIFENIPLPFTVTRYHSLIVEKKSLPEVLNITASVDSANSGETDLEIMALQHKSLPIVSVQFHPESVLTEQGHQLLKNFISMYNNYTSC